MTKKSTTRLLKEILSDDLESVYNHVTQKAVEWAVAGFMNEANTLLENLWKYDIPHSKHVWLQDEGLQVMWQLSGKQPANIPFPFTEIETIETKNRERVFSPAWHISYTSEFIRQPIAVLKGHRLFAKAVTAAHENSEPVEIILNALETFIKQDHPEGYIFFHVTTCGALLAARNNFTRKAVWFIEQWGRGYTEFWYNYSLPCLMRDRTTAKLLLKGILAPVFGLNEETCEQETREITEMLSERMKGRS